jgi:hypothetical protein
MLRLSTHDNQPASGRIGPAIEQALTLVSTASSSEVLRKKEFTTFKCWAFLLSFFQLWNDGHQVGVKYGTRGTPASTKEEGGAEEILSVATGHRLHCDNIPINAPEIHCRYYTTKQGREASQSVHAFTSHLSASKACGPRRMPSARRGPR